jgi:hypothetical protein
MRVAVQRARLKRSVRLVRRARKEVEFATSHIEIDVQIETLECIGHQRRWKPSIYDTQSSNIQ